MTAKRFLGFLCAIAVTLVSVTCLKPITVNALENGIYIADCTPHYAHPTTGIIEDSGGDGSSVLGQSMTESATYREALIEIDPDGNMFATVRLKLMDNIKNPTFKVQNDGNSGFYDVDYDIMKEDYDKNECDFRFKIPSENCIVRCTFYVIAMGRDVIYYIDFANLAEGSGDFVTSVEVRSQTVEEQPQTQTSSLDEPAQTQAPVTQPVQTQASVTQTRPAETTQQTSVSQETTTSAVTTSQSETSSVSAVTSLDSNSDTAADTSSEATSAVTELSDSSTDSAAVSIPKSAEINAEGIACFDEQGNEINPLDSENADSTSSEIEGNSGKSAVIPVAIAVGTVVIVGAVGVIIWHRGRMV